MLWFGLVCLRCLVVCYLLVLGVTVIVFGFVDCLFGCVGFVLVCLLIVLCCIDSLFVLFYCCVFSILLFVVIDVSVYGFLIGGALVWVVYIVGECGCLC